MSAEFRIASASTVSTAVAPSPGPAAPAAPGGGFLQVLQAVGAEVDRGERMVQNVLTGGSRRLSAGDLIALQAGIYRYTEVVDLSAKFVDRASAAVRTTLQSGG